MNTMYLEVLKILKMHEGSKNDKICKKMQNKNRIMCESSPYETYFCQNEHYVRI
jgi:hypothetical protein